MSKKKFPKLKKNDLIEVEWVDIETSGEWKTDKDASTAKCPTCKTCGYFINKTNGVLRISHSIGVPEPDDKELPDRDLTVIPYSVVRNIKVMTWPQDTHHDLAIHRVFRILQHYSPLSNE